MNLFATSTAPVAVPHGRPVGPVIPDLTTLWGFPCCARFPCVRAAATTPGAAAGRRRRSSHPAVSAFPDNVVGSACTSSFSRLAQRSLGVAARTLAPSPICDQLHRRVQPFRYLHDCSGCFRLERLPGGACTHWKAPPCHGAHVKRTLWIVTRNVAVRRGNPWFGLSRVLATFLRRDFRLSDFCPPPGDRG